MAYLTIFPVRGGMRANLFVYWSMEDAGELLPNTS